MLVATRLPDRKHTLVAGYGGGAIALWRGSRRDYRQAACDERRTYLGTWDLGPIGAGTLDLGPFGPGTWDLGLGTWDLGPLLRTREDMSGVQLCKPSLMRKRKGAEDFGSKLVGQ